MLHVQPSDARIADLALPTGANLIAMSASELTSLCTEKPGAK